VLIIGAAAGAGAAAADWSEKSEAGVLTDMDILLDTLSIVGNVFALGAAGLGKVVVSGALKTGPYARLAAYADAAYVPVALTAMGADVASFMILLGDAKERLAAIDEMEGSDEDRRLARARLVGQLLMAGTITLMSVKGSLPGIRRGGHLYLDKEPDGTLIARPTMSDTELLQAGQALKSPESVTELLKRGDLPKETLDRLRAGISQALSVGPVEKATLEQLLARLKAAKPDEVQGLLGELTARSRVGAYLGPELAGAIAPATATGLNSLEVEALMALRGAAARDLDQVAALVAQDAARANALLKEFGPDMLEHIKFNPVGGIDKLEKALADARKQLKVRKPGFFESVDPHGPPPGGLTFDKDIRRVETKTGTIEVAEGADWPAVDGVRVIETGVHGPDGAKGVFERAYDPKTGDVQMRQAFLRLGGAEKTVPGKVAHPGQQMLESGSPTIQYMTIYQLKKLGVPAGSPTVKQITMQDIENIETIVHLHWLTTKFPGVPAEELIGRTASVKYAQTSAIQSGYEPLGTFQMTPGQTKPIGALLKEAEGTSALRVKEHDALLKKYGFTRDTPMRMNFDISFPVNPK
jgi:hypothetical protein